MPDQLDRDWVSFDAYGVGVVDAEDSVTTLTHDRRRALAALNAFYRYADGERLIDRQRYDDAAPRPLRLTRCWVRTEQRSDGVWYLPAEASDPRAIAATVYDV